VTLVTSNVVIGGFTEKTTRSHAKFIRPLVSNQRQHHALQIDVPLLLRERLSKVHPSDRSRHL
jgi:hypothetical protein